MSKPNFAAIRTTAPLTTSLFRGVDPLHGCNLCTEAAKSLDLYRECDERDKPIPGDGALLYVGTEHHACHKQITSHPRLYIDAMGLPGSFPTLCGPCVRRIGLACTHPDLKANGGAGLLVNLSGGPMVGVIVCGRGGCRTSVPRVAKSCAGRRML